MKYPDRCRVPHIQPTHLHVLVDEKMLGWNTHLPSQTPENGGCISEEHRLAGRGCTVEKGLIEMAAQLKGGGLRAEFLVGGTPRGTF